MKRVIALFLIIGLLIPQFTENTFAKEAREGFYIKYDGKEHHYKDRTVTIIIDGKEVTTGDMPAIIMNDRTLVPAREVFESSTINAKVEWNGKKNEVYIHYKDKSITLKIGDTTAYINGKPVELDVPANLIQDISKDNAKTMIPLRFVIENLGFGLKWDYSTYTVSITSPIDEKENVKEENNDKDNNDKDNKDETIEVSKVLPTPLKGNPIIWGEAINSGGKNDSTSIITPEDNADVDITSVEYINNKFIIKANGPISSLEKTIWDGKFIVDITGARYGFDQNKLYKKEYKDNPLISEVRSSPKEDKDGKNVLRVVFDLINSEDVYDLSISADRRTLELSMETIELQRLELNQNELGDYILLTCSVAPEINSFRLNNPNRIVFDLPNTKTLINDKAIDNVLGQYVTNLRTSPFEKNTTRVVVDTDGQPDYTIKKIDSQTIHIQFTKPGYNNMKYDDQGNNPVIVLENAVNKINLEAITYEDKYMDRQYIINLPGNYENIFGSGVMYVGDSKIKDIEIRKNSKGNTSIIINENSIYVFRLEADKDNIFIKGYKPKEIYSKIIVVDFGHGGTDPGAVANGYKEKDINLAMGMYLKEYLDADSNIKVYYSRITDIFIPLQGRTDLANDVEADFVISLHNNAFNPESNGTETIYFKDADRPGLNSIELAEILQKHILKAAGLKNRGIKADNGLFILRNSKMPAAIVEVGFVTSKIDIVKITDKNIQKNVAKAIYDSIIEVFKTYPTGR